MESIRHVSLYWWPKLCHHISRLGKYANINFNDWKNWSCRLSHLNCKYQYLRNIMGDPQWYQTSSLLSCGPRIWGRKYIISKITLQIFLYLRCYFIYYYVCCCLLARVFSTIIIYRIRRHLIESIISFTVCFGDDIARLHSNCSL